MKNKLVLVIAAVIVAIALIVGISVYFYSSNSYVATVAGEKISKQEYTFFLNSVKQDMEQSAADKQTFWTSKIDGKDAKDVAKDRALDVIKEFKIQLIKAQNSKIVLDKSDNDKVNSLVDQVVQSSGGSRAKADSDIKSVYGVSLDQYKAIYKDYVLINKYQQQQENTITPNITEQEMKDFYDKNKDQIDKVTVKHILISTLDKDNNPLPQDKQDEAKKKADGLYARVKAGEDIAALAKQYSEDPGSKDNGGEYSFGKGEMVKEFEDWSFGAKPGDVGLVKTSYGYHVMKMEKRTAYDDVKSNLKSYVAQDKYYKELENLKNDKQYDIIKNEKVLNSIKVI